MNERLERNKKTVSMRGPGLVANRRVGVCKVLLLSQLAILSGCTNVGEKYTAGTLVVEVVEQSSVLDPVVDVGVRLFEEPDLDGEQGPGRLYRTDENGRFEHSWGWLGGGGEYAVRVVLDDSTFVSVDRTGAFAVRGTEEDNQLQWQIVVERR